MSDERNDPDPWTKGPPCVDCNHETLWCPDHRRWEHDPSHPLDHEVRHAEWCDTCEKWGAHDSDTCPVLADERRKAAR